MFFETEMDEATFKQQKQPEENPKRMVSSSLPEANQPEVEPSRNEQSSYPSEDSTKAYKSFDLRMDLDQAFQRSATLKKVKLQKVR